MFNVRDHTILFVVAGSRSYGLHNSDSDVDVKGICIPPIAEYRLGINENFEQADGREHLSSFCDLLNDEENYATYRDCQAKGAEVIAPDGVIYDVMKFFKLALNANPNILEVLFCDEEDIRFITPAGKLIRENRDIFLSKKVVWSYQGYAFAQMKRIKNHRSWLINPPSAEPTRAQFGLPPDRSLLTGDEQNAFLWVLAEILKDKVSEFRLSEDTRAELQDRIDVFGAIQSDIPDHVWPVIRELTGAPTEFIQIMQAERKYKSSMSHWKSYQNWVKTRNPKRAELERICGYDSKHALHLARLMLQGREILSSKTLTVRLPKETRDWLMWIRQGNMSFDELNKWFEAEQKVMKRLAESSDLPKTPDRKKANRLLIDLQMDAMRNNG